MIAFTENIALKGLKNSKAATNFFEAEVVTALLHNCELWIGIMPEHIQTLQDLQNELLQRILAAFQLGTPKGMIKIGVC